MQKILSFIDIKHFVIFSILNIVSSSVVFLDMPSFLNVSGIITLICLSVFMSFMICLVSSLLKRIKWMQRTFEIMCASFLLLALLINLILYVNFGVIFSEIHFNIIEGTNINESTDFLMTYANIRTLVVVLAIIFLIIVVYKFVPWILEMFNPKVLSLFVCVSLLLSVIKIAISIYSYVCFSFGGHLAAYSIFSRTARSYLIYMNTSEETSILIEKIKGIESLVSNPRCSKMVVIIGESYSKYHSQLYGYSKETTPLLQDRLLNDDLYLFTDVVTPINDTERAFRAIYSLGEYYKDPYCDYTLFPYVFRRAGWYTVNLDNLDLASKTSRVKDSKELSDILYNYRNTLKGDYDDYILNFLSTEELNSELQLYVIKLKGQHYTYASTFPEEYNHFKETDYSNLNLSHKQKQIIADYDNSTLYNDYIVNSIIEKFENENAVVVYFSDHGEEIYEERDFMGHGGTTPYLKYQFEVPLMIWMSNIYKQCNPEIVENIKSNKDKPYITGDISHTILDMAGVRCSQFVSKKSVANADFTPRERIINKTIVY